MICLSFTSHTLLFPKQANTHLTASFRQLYTHTHKHFGLLINSTHAQAHISLSLSKAFRRKKIPTPSLPLKRSPHCAMLPIFPRGDVRRFLSIKYRFTVDGGLGVCMYGSWVSGEVQTRGEKEKWGRQ